MFIIESEDAKMTGAAINLITEYDVNFTIHNDENLIIIKVMERDDNYEDYRLCEMAFQMNYRQKGTVLCGHCDEEVACGHLVFNSII